VTKASLNERVRVLQNVTTSCGRLAAVPLSPEQ